MYRPRLHIRRKGKRRSFAWKDHRDLAVRAHLQLGGPIAGDLGFFEFLDSVDAVIMGRNTYDKVVGFGPENWHYGDRHVGVLSTPLPDDADPRVTVYRDSAGQALNGPDITLEANLS
ncbi:hypothetical protein [Embleya sp. MST-111070]|uniref:hypothetical protein n=1 Tax=Embleya sp. MST-111070 TaxID=3398231 RepID=UPI003F7382A8